MRARMRIAIGGISHETSSYATEHTGTTELERFDRYVGPEIIEQYTGTATYLGGAITGARQEQATVVPTFFAGAQPSGLVATSAFTELVRLLVDSLHAVGPVDAVLLELHGACSTEDAPDADARVVAAVREVVGGRVPIAAVFDLHGNPTVDLVELLDLPLVTHHNPHSDQAERAAEAVRLLRRMRDGHLRPATALCRVPLLIPPATTYHGVGAEVLAEALDAENDAGMVDCSVFHGFPYTDTPSGGAAVVATADGSAVPARQAAARVATSLWSARERFLPASPLGPSEAVATATRLADRHGGPVVLNEASDNPGVGAAGDGTHLLRALLDARPAPGTACFGFVVCPVTAAAAHAAGEGADITVRIGAWSSPLAGAPVRTTAQVAATTDGRFTLTAYAPGMKVDLGPCARLEVDGVDVIVASRPMQTFCPQVFTRHGIDVRRRRIVALKSSQHFRDGFEPLATRIVTCDGPGLGTSRVDAFPRRHAEGGLWPVDRALIWTPAVEP